MSARRPPPPSSRLRPVGLARVGRLAACLLAAAVFLLPAAETAQAQTSADQEDIWSATLTVKFASGVDSAAGCSDQTQNEKCSTGLSDNSFGNTQVIHVILFRNEGIRRLFFNLNKAISQDWTLHVGDTEFAVADATLSNDDKNAVWSNTGLFWNENQQVSLRLTKPKPPRFPSGFGPLRLEPDAAMTPVTLPAATGGAGAPYTYSLTSEPAGLAGLSFDASTRVLSGTPEAGGRWTFTYTAQDGNSETARLTFRVTVGVAFEEQQQVVKRTLAAVASRTVSSALDTIGARLGDAAPGSGLTLAGEPVRLGGCGKAAGPGYGAAYPPDAFGRHGFTRGFGGIRGGCAYGPRNWSAGADRLFGASAFSLTLGAAPSGPAGRDARRRDAADAAPPAARNETIARYETAAQSRAADEPPGPGTIDPETEAMLDGRGSSDPEGDALKFSWTQVSGAKVTLRGADTPTPSFTAPAAPGPLTFRLTVTDKAGLSASAEVTLRVRDLAPGFGGAAPGPLALTVGREIDPVVLPAARGGNGTLRYSLTSRPAGLAGLDFDPATRTLSGTPTAAGRFAFTLRAVDVDGDAAELAVRVEASENREPVARIGKLNRAPVARAEPPAPAADARKTETQKPPAAGRSGKRAAADAGRPVLSVWGRGDFGAFAGRPDAVSRYRGQDRTGWLGVDARGTRGSGRWVAGLALSRGFSKTDYDLEGEKGRIETDLTAVWPYGRWTFANGLELRGLLGAGGGEARHEAGDGTREKSRLTMWAGAVGLRRALPPVAKIELAVRGDASFARMRTGKGDEAVDGLRADAWRLRGGVEASRRFALEDGASLTPFLEMAARRDGGDGVSGTGLELAGGLRYAVPGVAAELRGRWLAAHTEKGTEERGASLTVRLDPQANGRGLSLSLTPRWGAGTGGADALWREEMPKGAPGADAPGRLEGEIGYGLPMFGERFTGTPNAGFGLSDGGARDYRIGWRLTSAVRGDPGFQVDLDTTRREANGDDPAEHGVFLHSTIRW